MWVFKAGRWLVRFIWIAALSLVETEKRSASLAKSKLIDGSGWKEQLHNFVPDLLTLGEEGLTAASTAISIQGKTILSFVSFVICSCSWQMIFPYEPSLIFMRQISRDSAFAKLSVQSVSSWLCLDLQKSIQHLQWQPTRRQIWNGAASPAS